MALTKITSKMTDDTIPQKTTHGAMKLPVGATAQRPTGEAGDLRYNSTTGEFEGYTTEWGSIGGGIGAEYISATPTLSSSVVSQIVIGNYSSYVSPTFITKIGSTVIPNTNNSGTLFLSVDMASFSGTRTVSAFLCLKGIRNVDSTTTDTHLTNLPHWKQMDLNCKSP